MTGQVVECIFCGDRPCGRDCPDPWTFDPTPIENALGLHLTDDRAGDPAYRPLWEGQWTDGL